MEMDKTKAWANRYDGCYHTSCPECEGILVLFENYCSNCGKKVEWIVTDDTNLPFWA